jgi:aquaporin Z
MRPPERGFHWSIWGAEAAGTGLLVLAILAAIAFVVGEGAPTADWAVSSQLLLIGSLVAVAFVAIAVSPLGRLSGAHLNPAVSLAFWVTRHMSDEDLVGYLAAQLVGGLGAAFLFKWLWGDTAVSVGGGVTHPSVGVGEAVLVEALMTAALVVVLFGFLSSQRLIRWTPVAVGVLIALLVWQVAERTGTSLNPARSGGPAIAFEDFEHLWLYLLAPIAGALAVALVWRSRAVPANPLTAKVFHDKRYPCPLAVDRRVHE